MLLIEKKDNTIGGGARGQAKARSSLIFLIMAFLVLGNMVPLWFFRYFPSFDHPSHLLRQNILANYENPEFDYSQNFEIQVLPVPNILPDYIVALFAYVFPIETASKILYSLFFVLFPLSLLYFLRVTRPANEYLALSGCLFTYNFFFLVWGNENFCFSIPLFFIAFAYWWSHKHKMLLSNYVFLGIFCTMLYLTHILGFAIFIFSVFFTSLFRSRSFRRSVIAIVPTFPGIALYWWWTLKRGQYFDNYIIWDLSIKNKIHSLLEPILFYKNIGFSQSFQFAIVGCAFIYVIMLSVTLIRPKARAEIGGLIFTFAALLSATLFLPKWFLLFGADQRIATVAVFFGLPILSVPRQVIKRSLIAFLTVLSLAFNLVLFGYFGEQNRNLSVYKAALEHVPPSQKMLPLVLPPYTYWPPYHRFHEYYHIERGGINPFHLTQPIFSVTYAKRPPCNDKYDVRPSSLSPDILSYYDFVLIVGKRETLLSRDLEKVLRLNGYAPFYIQGIYSIFERKTAIGP